MSPVSGKSTAYTVFALWYALGNKDKAILICANKFKTAKDILQRIKMAYEELPLWLKPGIIEWNAASIKFDNGCKISAEATSGSSGRGGSINVLILDEFAFLKPSCITGETIITLKNKLTNKIIDIAIGDAKKTIIDYSKYQILTKTGYKDFSNIIVRDTNSYYNMKFKNLKTNEIFELNLTGQHLVMINDDWKKAAYIKVGTIIENNELISKIRICKKIKVYDAIDVNNERSFLAYNINLHNCEEEFLQSVFPVVSSSKTSKIIIVSTPNGMGNEFYRTWNRAQLNLNDGLDPNLKWQSVKIDWWEVPGRDEKWQKQQLETFNGSMDKFLQEYGNCLCGNTKIKLKNIITNEVFETSLDDLANFFGGIIKIKSNDIFSVETPNGFEKFDGITINEKECIKITLSNLNNISCSIDHPFVINNKIVRANKLKIDDYLETKYGFQLITKIESIGFKQCYDLINVGKDHIFYANNILTHNSFLGSAETLIEPNIIKQIKENFKDNALKAYDIQLHKDYPKTSIKIYEPPQKGHAYIIGADASLGTKSDYHSMVIYDITNTFDIKQVAGFYENDLPPKTFAFMLAKAGALYNDAFIAMENNGCSQVALDALWRDFDYDNIINDGGNPKTNIGIHSNNERKTIGCLTFKNFLEDELRKFQINDGRLIAEMEKFERKHRTGKLPSYEAADGHDDYMLAAIWGVYPIQMGVIDNYYDVRKTIVNKLGEQIPLYILPYDNDGRNKAIYLKDLDEKFKLFNNEYEKRLQDMKSVVSKGDEIEQFINANGLNEISNEPIEEETERKTDDDRFQFFARMN